MRTIDFDGTKIPVALYGTIDHPCLTIKAAMEHVQEQYGDSCSYVTRTYQPKAYSSISIGVYVKSVPCSDWGTSRRILVWVNHLHPIEYKKRLLRRQDRT